MEKVRFFAHISDIVQSKNKLQLAITKFVREHERIVFSRDAAAQFIELADATVKQLNAEHLRCKPEDFNATVRKENGNILLGFGDFVTLQLLGVKEVSDEK